MAILANASEPKFDKKKIEKDKEKIRSLTEKLNNQPHQRGNNDQRAVRPYSCNHSSINCNVLSTRMKTSVLVISEFSECDPRKDSTHVT